MNYPQIMSPLSLKVGVMSPSSYWSAAHDKGGGWQALWITHPEASKSCHELMHCQNVFTGRYKCAKAAFKWSALGFYSGNC